MPEYPESTRDSTVYEEYLRKRVEQDPLVRYKPYRPDQNDIPSGTVESVGIGPGPDVAYSAAVEKLKRQITSSLYTTD